MTPERARILFVDDDPHVLRGLRRSMMAMEPRWEMIFCGSAAEALAILARQPADAIVSDMRMPHMDGAQLLDLVRKTYPHMIRVILSGYAEIESVLKTVGPAHLYLAKPCDSANLCRIIERPLALRRWFADQGLRAAIGEVSSLPCLPEVFVKIESELHSPYASSASVAEILAEDMALTADVLKLTNSAFFGLGARMTTALQAVRTLGIETVQTLVLRVGLFRQFSGRTEMVPLLAALNDYALSVGKLAGTIALADGANDATAKAAHCAGLLSNVGCLIFLDRHSERFAQALAATGPGTSLPAAEVARLGADHHLAGAYLLGLWGFADDVVEAVAFAAHPMACPHRDNAVLNAVHVAYALGPRFPLLPDGVCEPERLDMGYLIDVRRDGRVQHWRRLAKTHLAAES